MAAWYHCGASASPVFVSSKTRVRLYANPFPSLVVGVMIEGMKLDADADQPAADDKPMAPRPEATGPLKKSAGMTRKRFGKLLKRAITGTAPKPAPKSP
jgi:hypothetical protein